jgi:hypothetical protein
MNIFYLDHSPEKAASMMCDKHVVKMIVETAQMLSTTHRYMMGVPLNSTHPVSGRSYKKYIMADQKTDQMLCKATMINHPCNVWIRESNLNYGWLYIHGMELMNEYTSRYGKNHSMNNLYTDYLVYPPANLFTKPFQEPPQAMPDGCKVQGNTVKAYRQYYIQEKSRFAKWKMGNMPDWYREGINASQVSTGNAEPIPVA